MLGPPLVGGGTGGGGGMSIGGTVTSGTAGSVLFVATGPVLAQDNTNLFWDDTNDVLTASGGIIMAEVAAVPGGVPGAGKGQLWTKNTAPSTLIFTDDAGTDFTLGAGGVSIGDAVGSGSANAVLFNDGSSNLGEDATNFLFDTSTKLFTISGGIRFRTTDAGASISYTSLVSDHIVEVTHTPTAAVTVTLVAAATAGDGFVQIIKDKGGLAGTNNITIDGNGGETIDGVTTYDITVNYDSVTLYCDGSNWFKI